jgi:UDP-N-acetylmuramate--alanine ligase
MGDAALASGRLPGVAPEGRHRPVGLMVLTKKIKRIHFVGIGGAGVSALAHLMLEMGYEVSGSDVTPSRVLEGLKQKGAIIFDHHDARHVRHANLVIISTAIPDTNEEVAAAKELGLPVLTRIDFLSYLAQRKYSISVSGSHGKSTTSAMISLIFYYADTDPTIVLGGQVKHLLGNSRLGRSDYFICEGDESNNSILLFAPRVAVVTNIDDDHMDFHKSIDNLRTSFLKFLNSKHPKGVCVVCMDDPTIASMLDSLERPKYTYGLSEGADFRAVDIEARHDSSRFKVVHREMGFLGEVNLPLPGTYNIQNALASIAVAHHCGIDFGKAAFALDNFTGVVRRFDRILERDDIMIVDDYAHHPSEIAALLNAVSGFKGRRVRAVFQPHRFTRSQRLAAKFPDAFVAADEIILADIYSALEKPIEGISTEYLYSFFERKFEPGKVKVILRQDEILTYLKKTLCQGDIILTIGAGDIFRVANDLAAYLRDKHLTYTGIIPEATESSAPEHAELFEGLRESGN